MSDSWDEFPSDDDETVFAQGRVDSRTYLSRSFPLRRTNSSDDGAPARFVCKVFDPATQSMIDRELDEWVIRTTRAGRYQIKLLVARDPGNVKELWIQRVPAPGTSGAVTNLLNLKQPEAGRLIEFLRTLDALPVEGDTTVRLDDDVLRDLLADPDSLSRLYRRAPEQLREMIRADTSAQDVLAVEARRQQVERFRRLLDDDAYFDSEVAAVGRGRPEAVWQRLFEANPWMLGVSLTGQLLTAWSDKRLEQVVVGRSVRTVGKRTDALMRTSGRIRSMVFTEIKTHRTPLLHNEYRPGCWSASSELVGAIAQLQGTVHRAVAEIGERLATVDEDGVEVPGDFTYLLRPRSFVIAGHLSQLTGESGGHHQDRIRSLELFRRQLREPEILTFDEVLARAEWALDLSERASE